MSKRKHDERLPHKPTPDDLAGTPACKEEDHASVKVRGRGRQTGRATLPASPPEGPPTADDLAGIPVCVEGGEDRTVRPSKRRQQR
jgi:hypothetical protein